ncbi:MAG: GNAT family N-acetyltransferase, partial [Planctomycetota bacterium]
SGEGGPRVECVDLTRIDDDLALAIGGLLARVWPKAGKDAAYRARQLRAVGAEHTGLAVQAPRTFYVRADERIVAAATIKPRDIRIEADPEPVSMTVMGLALVGSDPRQRGRGLGALVVRAAFDTITRGVAPACLFQTSHAVRPFYERLGACLVENRVVNSLADDPSTNPFWDEIVMRFPSAGDWPHGTIDLRGPGY